MAAGISIFTLMGSILVSNEQANQNIRQTEERAESLGGKFVKGVGTAAKWGAAIGAAAIAGGTALFGMAKKASDAGDRVDKMSQKIGVSKESFQSLNYVLGQNGADVEILQKGFQTLTGIMDKTADTTNKNKTALDTLGISVTDVNGKMKSQEEVFNESVKALMGMDEGVERSTLASELFGKKVASELVPMLNAGVESYEELTQRAHDLGFVMSDEAVAAGAAFNDSMDDVKKALGGVMTRIGIEVMPVFQTMLDWILAHMPEIQAVIKKVFEYIGIFVMAVVDIFKNYLLPAFQVIFDWTKENWPAIQKIIKVVIDTIVDIVKAFVDLFKAIWDKWGEDITKVAKSIWDVIYKYIEYVIKQVQTIIKTITALIKGDWEGVWNGIKDIFKNIWDGMAKLLPGLIEAIFNIMKGTFTIFTDIGKGMFGAVWEGMKGIWSSISSWVEETVSWLTDKLAFWKKGNDDMDKGSSSANNVKVNGSHANGLEYVPFSGYVAELHKGERVLTAQENKEYSQTETSETQEITINTPVILDGKMITTVTSRVQLQNNKGKARALGVVPI